MVLFSKEITFTIESSSQNQIYIDKPQILKIKFIFQELKLQVSRKITQLSFPLNYDSKFTIPIDTFSIKPEFAESIVLARYYEKQNFDGKFYEKKIPSFILFDEKLLVLFLNNPSFQSTIILDVQFNSIKDKKVFKLQFTIQKQD